MLDSNILFIETLVEAWIMLFVCGFCLWRIILDKAPDPKHEMAVAVYSLFLGIISAIGLGIYLCQMF